MTLLESLKSSVNYPLEDRNVEPLCVKRGLEAEAQLTTEIANSRAYELAYADVLRYVCTMVNLSQGGSVSLPSADTLAGTANAIYRKYGESLIGQKADNTPRITILND